MAEERWQVLSDWLSGWLEADPQVRLRLRDELAVNHPELIGDADRMISSADSLTDFLDTPALVLAARELAVDAPVLPEGATVGPYRVVQLLARGGMGDVYRATDSRLGRDVALKVLSPGRTSDPRRMERFLMEARVTASLDHPNIVRVYDVGRVDDQAYLVAELLDGETLRARIVRGPIGPDEVRQIALGVARGLAAAHDAGLVHRDLKPENIFLTRAGETKLLDFGIAKLTQDENVPDGASTLTGVVLGTAGYLAPEQVRGESIDGRADLFAFGAVLFEMVTGTRAFVREQIVDTLHAILHDPPALQLEHRPGVPLSLAAIVGHLLQKEPAARFQSAADLISALERADVGRTRSWPGRQIAKIRTGLRRPIWQIATAAALLAAVWAGMFLANGRGLPPIESVAVLLFENPADDRELDHICNGLTDWLLDHLSRVQPLTVKRGTTVRFNGLKDPVKAAQALGVGAVVTGAVSQKGNKIVISMELFDGATGERLWDSTVLVSKAGLMGFQAGLVLSIPDALRLRLSREQKARLGGSGASDPEAYDLYMKGRFLLQSDTEEDDLEAQKLFKRAVELDPQFLNAHMGIVTTYIRIMSHGSAPPREAEVQAIAALAKAIEIAPNNVSVLVARAHLGLMATHDWAATEKVYRAVMHEPALLRTTQFHPIGLFLAATGRPDEAVELVRRALFVDPGNVESRMMLGNYLLLGGRYEDALSVYKSISEDEPSEPRPWFGAAEAYKRLNDSRHAAEARRRAHELDGDEEAMQAFAAATTPTAYADAEKKAARAAIYRRQALASTQYIHPFYFARLYVQIGDRQNALDNLERAAKDGGHSGLMLLKVDPVWASLRAHPRFTAVLRQLGIP